MTEALSSSLAECKSMRIRLKTKWNNQTREVSLTDTVSVLAFNAWKIGMQA